MTLVYYATGATAILAVTALNRLSASCARADAMLNTGQNLAAVLQKLEVSKSTPDRWRKAYDGMKSQGEVRLKQLEEENRRLKELVAEKELDIKMLCSTGRSVRRIASPAHGITEFGRLAGLRRSHGDRRLVHGIEGGAEPRPFKAARVADPPFQIFAFKVGSAPI